MNFNDYQTQARQTAVYPDKGNNFIYPTLGLVDEAGEVAGKVKKFIRDQHKYTPGELNEADRTELLKEMGDVLWYVANLTAELGCDLNTVAQLNVDKLTSRAKRGTIGGSGDNR